MTAGRRRVVATKSELCVFSRLLGRGVRERFSAPFAKFSSDPFWTYGEPYRLVPYAEGGALKAGGIAGLMPFDFAALNTKRCRTTGRDRNAG